MTEVLRRVCLVGSLAPPPGGVATYCTYLATGLALLGWRVSFVDTSTFWRRAPVQGLDSYHPASPTRNRLATAAESNQHSGVLEDPDVAELIRSLRPNDRRRARGIRDRIIRINRRRPIDIVHGNHAAIRSLGALWAAYDLGLPFVVTIFGSEFVSPSLRPALKVARLVCERATRVIAISRHTANVAARAGVSMDLDIVYPGIDHERYEHSVLPAGFHSRWGLDHRKLTVLYVGALVERKGPQVLLTAMGGLGAQARAVAQAVFIGPDLGGLCDLRAAAARHASGLVHVIGEVDAEQVDAFYRLADIFVFPTITEDEGFGLVAAEAAASGCAIVASRIGAIPEVVSEGVNATLVPPNDAAALAGALTRLIEDERRRSSYQEGSPGVARKFSWRQTADQIDRMLRDLLIA